MDKPMPDEVGPQPMVRIELTRDEFNGLLLTMGYALGCCSEGDTHTMILRTINAVNRGNPHFEPYAIPGKEIQ